MQAAAADPIDAVLDVDAPFTDEDIERLFGDVDPHEPDPDDLEGLRERFGRYRIEDVGGADWVGRTRRRALARNDELIEHVSGQIAQLQDFLARATAADARTIEWADGLLVDWSVHRRETQGTNTVKVPSATMTGRRVQPKHRLDDPIEFARWALANDLPDVLYIESRVSKFPKESLVIDVDGDRALYLGEPIPGVGADRPEVGTKVRETHDHDSGAREWVSYTVKATGGAPVDSGLGSLEAADD